MNQLINKRTTVTQDTGRERLTQDQQDEIVTVYKFGSKMVQQVKKEWTLMMHAIGPLNDYEINIIASQLSENITRALERCALLERRL